MEMAGEPRGDRHPVRGLAAVPLRSAVARDERVFATIAFSQLDDASLAVLHVTSCQRVSRPHVVAPPLTLPNSDRIVDSAGLEIYTEVVASRLCTGCVNCVLTWPHDVSGYERAEGK
ncbi:MAG: hypothetical protein AB7H92_08280 [Microbacteriaceae bacterium]